MPDVCAIVLTRNRKGLLLECLSGLERQTSPVAKILVVDNASSDGTHEELAGKGLLEGDRVRYLRLDRNLGSAGGYSAGIAAAREEDVEWLWIMDDDAEPRPDALERLMAAPPARDGGTAALACAVAVPSGEVDLLHRGRIGRFMRELPREEYRAGNYPSLDYSSFTGMTVRNTVARAIDPPRADFFIWGDDVEYSIRLRNRGQIRLVPESVIVHKFQMGGEGSTRRGRFWNRLLGTSYPSATWEDYWKTVNSVRNFAWIKHRYGDPSRRAFAVTVAGYIAKTLMFERQPLRRIPWIVRAARAGREGRTLDMTPDRWREIA
jgi:rhamnopyranosyl-N-acetylglucosaminyl-diphospho-decaprenol beta-1,3/1,4-galactofuranosyltransferase